MTYPKERVERDLIGELGVPYDAYFGIHTVRAVNNFAISGRSLSTRPGLITALACVKQAAARANYRLGWLEEGFKEAICQACEDVKQGKLRDQFPIDVIQGGAGTSTNMNMNEVLANRALEILNHNRGDYGYLHPIEHVNMSQSTNDVYPSAIRLTLYWAGMECLDSLLVLSNAFASRAHDFRDVIKLGRTQLQDAVPMTLAQEFRAFSGSLNKEEGLAKSVIELLLEVNLGGTAIGTELNAPPGYRDLAVEELRFATGLPVRSATDLIEATQDTGIFVQMSGVLKSIAVKLSKICNDLRLLSSGPRAGLRDINLPQAQAGSSIMPGKINPVIPEVVNQVAFRVIGNDLGVTLAAEAGQLQLNAFEPIILDNLLESTGLLSAAMNTLRQNCVEGITANKDLLRHLVESSASVATALNPYIGYAKSTDIARQALDLNMPVPALVRQKGLLTAEQTEQVFSIENLTGSAYFHSD